MRIVHLSYAAVKEYKDPDAWLRRINFFVLLLEKMSVNHRVMSIHCINYSGTLVKGGVEYHFLKGKDNRFSTASGINKYVAALRPDVIIVHGLHFPLQVISLQQKVSRNVRIVIQHHAEKPLKHYKAILQRFIDSSISAYFFTSMDQAHAWVEKRQIGSEGKVFEIMEVPSVFLPTDRSKAKGRTGIKDKLTYLWVGRFDNNKDPLTLIKAFAAFARSNQHVALYVVFRGGHLRNEIEKLLERTGAGNQIKLVGEVSHEDLLYWYNSADFIISTSHYEGSGVAVAEGMSCGCIPVLTNIASFNTMTGNRNFGRFFNPGNVEQLVNALTQSLNIDVTSERQKVLSYYQSNLSADAISAGMLRVCEQVLNNSLTK